MPPATSLSSPWVVILDNATKAPLGSYHCPARGRWRGVAFFWARVAGVRTELDAGKTGDSRVRIPIWDAIESQSDRIMWHP
jgi:hypothetical protein